MVPRAAAGGQATSHRDREMTMAPGRGKTRESNQDEGPLPLGLHHRAMSGRQDKAADVPCRLSRKIVGRRGKEDRVLNLCPQAIVPTGGQDGAQAGAIKTNRRLDSRTRRTTASRLLHLWSNWMPLRLPLRGFYPPSGAASRPCWLFRLRSAGMPFRSL